MDGGKAAGRIVAKTPRLRAPLLDIPRQRPRLGFQVVQQGLHEERLNRVQLFTPYALDFLDDVRPVEIVDAFACRRTAQQRCLTLRPLQNVAVIRAHAGELRRGWRRCKSGGGFTPAPGWCYGSDMRYVSTRGGVPPRDFLGVLTAGLAEDGGLFVPESLPQLCASDWRELAALPYAELAARIVYLFAGDCLTLAELRTMCAGAYAGFRRPAVVPLVQLEAGLWVQELFHGPTLAFKDLAMQLLGRMFEHELTRSGKHVTIVGATSGDTGPAALAACADRTAIDIVMLHPQGRTSEVQRLQMTTVAAPNVLNLAIDGTFDDCQDLVKAMFADAPFRSELHLSAVNSINWARIAAQVPYYVFAALALGAPDRAVSFCVPTGNFGNVLAAWIARGMGLPIHRLVVATNRNDILYRFIEHQDMSVRPVTPSLAPSMDIQVSSNFERLLFELLGRDPAATAETIRRFRRTGTMAVPHAAWSELRRHFRAARLDDEATVEAIRELHEAYGYAADPHTAIAIAIARDLREPEIPMIAMATAHEGKFREAVRKAILVQPPLPPTLADLYERVEHVTRAPADLAAVQARVRAFALRNAA